MSVLMQKHMLYVAFKMYLLRRDIVYLKSSDFFILCLTHFILKKLNLPDVTHLFISITPINWSFTEIKRPSYNKFRIYNLLMLNFRTEFFQLPFVIQTPGFTRCFVSQQGCSSRPHIRILLDWYQWSCVHWYGWYPYSDKAVE